MDYDEQRKLERNPEYAKIIFLDMQTPLKYGERYPGTKRLLLLRSSLRMG